MMWAHVCMCEWPIALTVLSISIHLQHNRIIIDNDMTYTNTNTNTHTDTYIHTSIYSRASKVRTRIASWCKQLWTAQQIRCKREHGENKMQRRTKKIYFYFDESLSLSTNLLVYSTLLCVRSPRWINSIHYHMHTQQHSFVIDMLRFSSIQFILSDSVLPECCASNTCRSISIRICLFVRICACPLSIT